MNLTGFPRKIDKHLPQTQGTTYAERWKEVERSRNSNASAYRPVTCDDQRFFEQLEYPSNGLQLKFTGLYFRISECCLLFPERVGGHFPLST